MNTELVERSIDADSDLWDRDFDAALLAERSLDEGLWTRDSEDVELLAREAGRELWDRGLDEDALTARERDEIARREAYNELATRERPGRDARPRPIRPRPAPITITVQPPTPPGSGANSPARHGGFKRDNLYDELIARERSGRDMQPRPIRPRPAPITITVQPPTPPGSGANSPARHGRSKRDAYGELVARERYGRDMQPRPIRPRPAPITITVQPPTPPGSGANSPARHGRSKREEFYDALVARMESMFDELD